MMSEQHIKRNCRSVVIWKRKKALDELKRFHKIFISTAIREAPSLFGKTAHHIKEPHRQLPESTFYNELLTDPNN